MMKRKKMHSLVVVASALTLIGLPSLSFADGSAYWMYTVRKGDTLWSFSERHLISPAYAMKLKSLNQIKDPYSIRPNSVLKVPLQWGKTVEGSASVAEMTGRVSVTYRSGENVAASVGMKLPTGSRVSTERGAQATLKFIDGSFLILNSETTIALDKQVYFPTTGASTNTIGLEKGSVNGSIQHPPLMNNRYEIRTKTAVTAIKGTELDVSVDGGGATRTSVFSGKVDVSSGPQIVAVEEGFGSVVGQPENVQKEKLLPPPKLKNDNAKFEDNLPVVSWKSLSDAEKYKVELYSTTGQSDLLMVRMINGNDVLLPVKENGDYLVQVYGVAKSGLLGLPEKGHFSLSSHPLPPIEMAPSKVDTRLAKTVTFKLGKEKDIKSYRVQIAKDKKFSKNVDTIDVDVNKPKLVVPESGQWYWRVASVMKNGDVGSYGPINQLKVGALLTKGQERAALRVRPIDIKGISYQLDLVRKQDKSKKVFFSKKQETPEWFVYHLPSDEYIAQVTYFVNDKLVYQTPLQEIEW